MELVLILGGVILSAFIEWFKKQFKPTRTVIFATLAFLALLLGAIYQYLLNFGLWESFLQILITAGAIYAFIVKTIEAKDAKK